MAHDTAVHLHQTVTETGHLVVDSLKRCIGGGQTLLEIWRGLQREDWDPTLAKGHPEVFPLSHRDHLAAQRREWDKHNLKNQVVKRKELVPWIDHLLPERTRHRGRSSGRSSTGHLPESIRGYKETSPWQKSKQGKVWQRRPMEGSFIERRIVWQSNANAKRCVWKEVTVWRLLRKKLWKYAVEEQNIVQPFVSPQREILSPRGLLSGKWSLVPRSRKSESALKEEPLVKIIQSPRHRTQQAQTRNMKKSIKTGQSATRHPVYTRHYALGRTCGDGAKQPWKLKVTKHIWCSTRRRTRYDT